MKVFSESDQSTCQETSAASSDFSHPSKDYVNYMSTDLSAQMMSTQNDSQNSGRQSAGFRSWIKHQILFQHQYNFLLLMLKDR